MEGLHRQLKGRPTARLPRLIILMINRETVTQGPKIHNLVILRVLLGKLDTSKVDNLGDENGSVQEQVLGLWGSNPESDLSATQLGMPFLLRSAQRVARRSVTGSTIEFCRSKRRKLALLVRRAKKASFARFSQVRTERCLLQRYFTVTTLKNVPIGYKHGNWSPAICAIRTAG